MADAQPWPNQQEPLPGLEQVSQDPDAFELEGDEDEEGDE